MHADGLSPVTGCTQHSVLNANLRVLRCLTPALVRDFFRAPRTATKLATAKQKTVYGRSSIRLRSQLGVNSFPFAINSRDQR